MRNNCAHAWRPIEGMGWSLLLHLVQSPRVQEPRQRRRSRNSFGLVRLHLRGHRLPRTGCSEETEATVSGASRHEQEGSKDRVIVSN